jgi:hypothetical protein
MNGRRFDCYWKVGVLKASDPAKFLRVRDAIELGDFFERIGHARFFFRIKRITAHQRKPEAVGQNHVVQESSELRVARGSLMLADGP